jgi:hypothetical protein
MCGTWVAPGGHLIIQDYDLRSIAVVPALETISEFERVATGASSAPQGGSTNSRREATAHGDHAALWPLLIGAWKRKPAHHQSE